MPRKCLRTVGPRAGARTLTGVSRYLLLCWRDDAHPQGGGSERYLAHVAAGLAAAGHEVVYRTSRPRGAARDEERDGYRISRGGGRFTVYPRALGALLAGRLGLGPLAPLRTPDAVVDTQNGVPFFSRLVAGAPVVVLVHHVHREQWPVAGPVVARLGWWIESRLAPRVHRRCQYVTVSSASAEEIAGLGVDPARIAVVRNGLAPLPAGGTDPIVTAPDDAPRLVVLSRLVPHKHVEDALGAVAALRGRHPGLVLDVVGDGWWAGELREHARRLGLVDGRDVVWHGHVDEVTKHRLLGGARVHLLPSRKEGWGLAVMEAAQHGVPTIGYHHSVGLRDSVLDGRTGLLVDDAAALTAACARLLDDDALRTALGEAARERAADFSWSETGAAMGRVLRAAGEGRIVSDPV